MTEGTSLQVKLREKPGRGYGFFASSSPGHNFEGVAHRFGIQRFGGGPSVLIGVLDGVSFHAGEEWFLEAGAVGDRISLTVWRPGEPKPPTPQLAFTDTTHRYGQVSLNAYIGVEHAGKTQVWAAFDDVSFTPVLPGSSEPSSR